MSSQRASSSGVIRGLAGLACWFLALSLSSARAAEVSSAPALASAPSSPARSGKGDALLVGSSSMNQSLGHLISRELSRRGYRVTRKGVSAAGLARPDYRDMNQIMEELPISEGTAAVFVYLGMNDAQALWLRPDERSAFGRTFLSWSDQRWHDLYVQRAHDLFERICERGAQRAIVLLPVDVKRDRLQRRLARIRALQARAASSSSCAVALSTAGDLGRFDAAGVSLRRPDGLHMSMHGAIAVWRRIQSEALRLVASAEPRLEPRGAWCAASCRMGQGLRYRPESRRAAIEGLAILLDTAPSSEPCATW